MTNNVLLAEKNILNNWHEKFLHELKNIVEDNTTVLHDDITGDYVLIVDHNNGNIDEIRVFLDMEDNTYSIRHDMIVNYDEIGYYVWKDTAYANNMIEVKDKDGYAVFEVTSHVIADVTSAYEDVISASMMVSAIFGI